MATSQGDEPLPQENNDDMAIPNDDDDGYPDLYD